MLKQFIERHKARRKAQYQRMNSEILCAIIRQVDIESQYSKEANIPSFLEVDKRYNSLGIKTPKRLCEVYRDFYFQGLVSGIDL